MTPETLIQMNDRDFEELACKNLYDTSSWQGPFQKPQVIDRTLEALNLRLCAIEAFMDRVAEDPTYPAEKWEATEKFQAHLTAVIANTEKHLDHLARNRSRRSTERAWKRITHELCDNLVGTDAEWLLDDVNLNEYFGTMEGMSMTLREWVAARCEKQPSRAAA